MAGDDLLRQLRRFHREALVFAFDHWLPTIPTDAQRKAVADAVTTRYQLTDHHFQPAANPWQLQLIGLGRFDSRTFSVTCTRRACIVTARYPLSVEATDNDDEDSILGGLVMGLLGCAESRVGPATYSPDETFMVNVAADLPIPPHDLPSPGDVMAEEDTGVPEDTRPPVDTSPPNDVGTPPDVPPPEDVAPPEDLRPPGDVPSPEEVIAPDDTVVVDIETADICIAPMTCDVADVGSPEDLVDTGEVAEDVDAPVPADLEAPDVGPDVALDVASDAEPDVQPDVQPDAQPDVPIAGSDASMEDVVDVIITPDPGAEDLPVPDIAPDPGPADEGAKDVPPLPPDPLVYGVAQGMVVATVYIDAAMTQAMAVCEEPGLMVTKESCWAGTWIAVAPLSNPPIAGAVLCYDPKFAQECQADEPVPINQACCMACNAVVEGFNDCDLYCGEALVGFGKLVADAEPPFLTLTMEFFATTQAGAECVYSFSSKACPNGLQSYTCQ